MTVTFSAGIGQVCPQESLHDAFERIDQALYAAKKAGRNTIIASELNNQPYAPDLAES